MAKYDKLYYGKLFFSLHFTYIFKNAGHLQALCFQPHILHAQSNDCFSDALSDVFLHYLFRSHLSYFEGILYSIKLHVKHFQNLTPVPASFPEEDFLSSHYDKFRELSRHVSIRQYDRQTLKSMLMFLVVSHTTQWSVYHAEHKFKNLYCSYTISSYGRTVPRISVAFQRISVQTQQDHFLFIFRRTIFFSHQEVITQIVLP